MHRRRSFLLGLVLSLCVMGAVGLWLSRSKPGAGANARVVEPGPEAAVGEVEQAPKTKFAATAPAVVGMRFGPQVDFSRPAAPESFPEDPLSQKAVQAAAPLVTQCFTAASRRIKPPIQAELKFTLKLDGESATLDGGEIVEASVTDAWTRRCLLDAISDVRFPAPEGARPVTVTWPFRFAQK